MKYIIKFGSVINSSLYIDEFNINILFLTLTILFDKI